MSINPEVERLTHLLESRELLEYIETHPEQSPEQVLAHFGVPFDPELWNETIAKERETAEQLRTSPNPRDRTWGEER